MHDEYIQNMSEDIYNVNNYTDNQLYDILNLNNPTDRELEAKINSMIWKYTNMGNDSGDRLVYFFQDIYDRFFEGEEKDENDITPDMILRNNDRQPNDEMNNEMNNKINDEMNNKIDDEMDVEMNKNNEGGSGSSDGLENSNVEYTAELEYSKGKLNPLLQHNYHELYLITKMDF